MYLAGYAVECTLKVRLMKTYHCFNLGELEKDLQDRGLLPPRTSVFTHELEMLLGLTNATDRLRMNRVLWDRFNVVNAWMPAWRYSPDLSNEEDARDFLDAVHQVVQWIEHNV